MRDATEYGPTAPHLLSTGVLSAIIPDVVRTGDDYLNLNVWTADVAGSAPVMVFIHGGSFTSGSGGLPGYDGSRFARDGVLEVQAQLARELTARPKPALWGDAAAKSLPFLPVVDGTVLPAHRRYLRARAGARGADVLVGILTDYLYRIPAIRLARPVADSVLAAWVAFARTGDPGWERYAEPTRVARRFGTVDELLSDDRTAERLVCDGIR